MSERPEDSTDDSRVSDPPPAPAEQPSSTATRVQRALVGLVAVTALAALGAGVFFRVTPMLTLGTLAGIVAAFACDRYLDAAVVGFVGAIAGTFLATGISSFAWVDMAVWLPVALIAGLVAGVLAAAVRFALGRSARLGTAFVAVALIVLLGATWLAAIQDAGAPQVGGMSYAQYYAQEPAVSANMHDEGLYLLYVHRLAAGQPYYSMVARALVESNAVRDDVSVTSPLSYRLPTLYVMLSRMPQDGISYVLAALALGTATVLSAYALARLYMGPAFALVSATAVATYVASSAPTPALLHTEYWAGGLALVAVTLFAAASRSERRATALNVAAAVVAVAAVAFRELAIAFVVLGLIATLAFPEGRRARTWIAWAAGLVAASAIIGGHWMVASGAIAASNAAETTGAAVNAWLHLDGKGLPAAIALASRTLGWRAPALWLLFALAPIGAFVGPRDRGVRTMLLGSVVAGAVVIAFLYPAGTSGATVPSYWAETILPTVIATSILAACLLPGVAEHPQDAPAEQL